MDVMEAILSRRSVRKYHNQPIPDEDLAAILEAARQAPSARNRQPWHMVAVLDRGQRLKLAGLCLGQLWLAKAGMLLVGIARPKVSENWCVIDTTIALENAVLAAQGLGYGSCWIGAFHQGGVKALLGIPDEERVVAILAVGVPAQEPKARSRKPLTELISRDKYGQEWE
jgi:nitroreductase